MKKILWSFVLSFAFALGTLAARPIPQSKPEELIGRQLSICPSGQPVISAFYGKDPENINLIEIMLMDETVFAALVYEDSPEHLVTDVFIKDETGKVRHFTGKKGQALIEEVKAAVGGPCDIADRIHLKRETI